MTTHRPIGGLRERKQIGTGLSHPMFVASSPRFENTDHHFLISTRATPQRIFGRARRARVVVRVVPRSVTEKRKNHSSPNTFGESLTDQIILASIAGGTGLLCAFHLRSIGEREVLISVTIRFSAKKRENTRTSETHLIYITKQTSTRLCVVERVCSLRFREFATTKSNVSARNKQTSSRLIFRVHRCIHSSVRHLRRSRARVGANFAQTIVV